MASDELDLSGPRRTHIARVVRERGQVSVRDLCDEFGKSEATIRRDLSELARKGIVTRTHGGVTINSNIIYDLPNEKRKLIAAAEKRRIGHAAIEMLKGDEVVYLDAGTTSLAVAEQAYLKPHCHYVTSSLGIARQLRAHEIKNLFVIGGAYNEVNDAFVGALAVSAMRSLSFDVAFLCCTSISVHRKSIGLSDHAYCQVQKEAISASRSNFVIADSKKFDATAFMWTANFRELDGIITNKELDEEYLEQLKQEKLEVVLA